MFEILIAAMAATGGFLAGRWRQLRPTPAGSPLTAETRNRILGLMPGESAELGIDYLLDHVPVTEQSLNIHLAVASLARDRGDTEDAIRVHRHVLEHLDSDSDGTLQAGDVRMELVRDYLAAGLLDRAELLLTEMIEAREPAAGRAEEHLLEVYQRERDWPRAVALGRRLLDADNPQVHGYLAHFLCELAGEHGARHAEAEALFEEALRADPLCVRARLALADLRQLEGRHDDAAELYAGILDQDVRFAGEALTGLRATHIARETLNEYHDWLTHNPRRGAVPAMAAELARVLQLLGRGAEALPILRAELAARPTPRLFRELLELERTAGSRTTPESVHAYAEAWVDDRPAYRCEACGFSTHMLLWCCPSCKRWSSVLPVDVLSAEGG